MRVVIVPQFYAARPVRRHALPQRGHDPNVMFTIASNTPVHLGIGKELVSSKPSKFFPYVPAVPSMAGSAPGPA